MTVHSERIADLEEQVRYLLEMIAPCDNPYEDPEAECPLPPVLAAILHVLMERPIAPTRLIIQVVELKGTAKEDVEASTVRVHMNRLRNYLKPYGIGIGSKQGSGYYLREAEKQKVRSLFAPASATGDNT